MPITRRNPSEHNPSGNGIARFVSTPEKPDRPRSAEARIRAAETVGKLVLVATPFIALLALLLAHQRLFP